MVVDDGIVFESRERFVVMGLRIHQDMAIEILQINLIEPHHRDTEQFHHRLIFETLYLADVTDHGFLDVRPQKTLDG